MVRRVNPHFQPEYEQCVRYCSFACQSAHWSAHHKRHCAARRGLHDGFTAIPGDDASVSDVDSLNTAADELDVAGAMIEEL